MRFISRHDSFKDDIYKKLDVHSTEMKGETSKIEAAVKVVHDDLRESQQIMLNFKSGVQDELYKVKIESKQIAAELKAASESSKNIHETYQKTEKTLADNQKILQIVAKGIVAHRADIEKLKSEVVKISEEMILIKKKD